LPELPLQAVRLLTKGTVKNMPIIMLISNSSLFYLRSIPCPIEGPMSIRFVLGKSKTIKY
jgi:hypothetical protein